MSLSRAELDAMNEEELKDTIVELSQTIEDQQLSIDVLIDRVNELEERCDELAAVADRVETLETRLDEDLAPIEADAKAALRAATAEDRDRSKTEIATALTRNLLVVRAANGGPAQDRPVKISTIQERAEPEHELAWAIVDRAWTKLLEEWPQFHRTTKDGQKALSLRPSKVTPALARTVETDLGRDDLTKRFVGGNGGGSA